jgi:hypothetical protein
MLIIQKESTDIRNIVHQFLNRYIGPAHLYVLAGEIGKVLYGF